MLERVEGIIFRYNMLPPGRRLGVAVSGGADSVFLLHFLKERGGVPLSVLHVNHGLRGEDSEGDAAFVEELAARLGLPFTGHRMGLATGNLEQYCRRERMAFFRKAMADGLVDLVATGHTASDQAETFLMRLLRGAGTTGMRGILPVTAEGLVRPLLHVGRDEVRAYLAGRGLAWREDASNETEAFLRNRVRARLLPVMRELDPDCEAALGRVAEMAATDEDYWRQKAGAVLDRVGRFAGGALVLDRRELMGLHPAMLGRALRMGLERALGSLRRVDRGHLDRVAALALGLRGEGAVEVPGGRVTRSMDWLRIGGDAAVRAELAIPGEFTDCGYTFRAWVAGAGGYNEQDATVLDWERLRPPVRLRAWEAGDRFQPAGAAEAKPVKEFFERARVPSWDRRLWPMITDSDGIVWIYQFGTAARAAASSATEVRLYVRCDTVSSK